MKSKSSGKIILNNKRPYIKGVTSLKKILNIFSFAFSMILYMIAGFLVAAMFENLILGFLLFYIFFLVHIIIHETGHLVFGLMTGYKFLSFRIGSFTIQKENGEYFFKKFSIPGTAGQCLLGVPDVPAEECPYLLYHAGGGLMNLITALIVLPFIFISGGILKSILIMFAALGIITALQNLIPLKMQGINNDGLNIVEISRNDSQKRMIYNQLKINYLTTLGTRYCDIEQKYFDDENCEGLIADGIRAVNINRFLDMHDFESAGKLAQNLIDGNISGFYGNEVKCELLFYKIISGADRKSIDDMLDKNLKNYIKSTCKYYLSKIRIMYAYNLLIEKNTSEAQKYKDMFEKVSEKYPVKADITLESELMDIISQKNSAVQ